MAGQGADAKGVKDDKAAGVGQAAWKLEDAFRGERSVREYPSQREARDLYIQVAGAESVFRRALLGMVVVSILETPSWCNTNEGWFFPGKLADPGVRCELKGVNSDDLMLSTVPYIPPGWGLVIECVLMFIIMNKLLLERRLQMTYFEPLRARNGNSDYIRLDMVNFGLVMVAIEAIDCLYFVAFRPNWRLAFISRTGYLCLLPAMQEMFSYLKKVIVEFVSIASFLMGTILFFAWICVTIFKDLDGEVFGERANKGFESFSASLYTMYVAGATDDFVACFINSYTKYRWSGLLWLLFLAVVQVLLLSLVLDTLVAAYTTYREHLEESSVKKNVQGIMETFDILIEATGGDSEGRLTKESFMTFVREFGRSPRARTITDSTAEIMFAAVDRTQDGAISKPEFGEICGVMEYELWTTTKYSNLQTKYPEIWNSGKFQWFIQKVDGGGFDVLMNLVLLVNLVLVVTETYCDLSNIETPAVISHLELIFSLIYVVEVALRLCVYSWPEYWSFRSNQFDFFTTWALLASSVVETIAADATDDSGNGGASNIKRYMNILRLLRLLRVVKQLKQLKVVQFMVDTIMKLVAASKDVLIPLGVTVFFFTTLSVQLWGGLIYISNPKLKESEFAEGHQFVFNYNDFLMAFGAWIVSLLMEFNPGFAESIYLTSPYPSTWWVFFIFYVCGVSIVFELVKAFTIEVFVELTKRKNKKTDDVDEDERALEELEQDFEAKGASLHYRNIGDVMMQEKMKEAFMEIKERMEEEEKEHPKHD